MAINPLIIFASLSVATVGGIVVVQQVNKPAPIEQVQKQTPPTPAPLLEPAVKNAQAPVQKLASIEPKKFPAAKLDSKSLKALTKSSGPVAPSFDVVRIEKNGGAVVVGKAAPNAEISLKLNGKVIGTTKSNKQGDWVFIPDQLIPSGNHELIIKSKEANKKPVRSKQSIFIAIAKNAKDKPLVVVATPDAPTKILQVPQSQEPSKPETIIVAKAEPKTSIVTPQVSTPKQTSETVIKPAVPKTADALPKATAPLTTPQAVESRKVETAKIKTPDVKAPIAAAVKKPKQVASIVPKKQAAKAVPAKRKKLVFGTVDYNDQGNIVFSGTATPNKTVRLYIDNKIIGDAVADNKGHWVFKGNKNIKVGVHELRADQITVTGSVAQRTAVPFMRAAPRKVAALIKNRGIKNRGKTQTTQTPKFEPTPSVSNVDVTAANQPSVVKQQPAASETKVKAKGATKVANKEAVKTVQAGQPAVNAIAKSDVETNQPNTDNSSSSNSDKPKLVSHVVIQPGNNLWNISRVIYGKGVAYTTIYQANKTQVKDPNRIYPGQILETPGAMSTGSIGPDERGDGGGNKG